MSEVVAGIRIPDSKLAREATDLLREHGTPLLLAHSLRVFLFGAIRGRHRGLKVDHELLYLGAVFHDLGLTAKYRSRDQRFEVDSANAAWDFLRANGIDESTAGVVWDAIALHTTPEIRGTSGRRSRSSPAGWRRTSSATGSTRSRPATATPSSPRIHAS